jgi:hypothetical protein
VELQNSRRMKTSDTDNERVESVLVKSSTNEQLDPIYTALSKAAHTFPPGSAAEAAFRKRADEFVNDLLYDQNALRLAIKRFNKSDGTVGYSLAWFAEDSVVTEKPDGGFSISGKQSIFQNRAEKSKVEHIFGDGAQPQ